ncbi:hypothetical protein IAT38_003696 [Cryptococcus sp. DSM 104549]
MPPHLSLGESTPLANQVAGHDGVMSDASGSLVIKPALPREIAFYQMLSNSDRTDPIRALKPFVPRSYGTLRLEGQLAPGGEVDTSVKGDVPESVVLENLSYAYTHPNIMDVKLGTVLYAPDASDEKRQRMDKQARETTTQEKGLRLTGCQTWHAPTQTYISTPKSFGKTIKADQLPTGMVRFFPLPADVIPSLVAPLSPPPTATTATPTADGAATHLPSTAEEPAAETVAQGVPPTPDTATHPAPSGATAPTQQASPSTYTSHALPPALLLRLLALLSTELARLSAVLHALEIRFVGASVLIVYEGDEVRLGEALDRWEAKEARGKLRAAVGDEGPEDGRERSAFSEDGSVSSLSGASDDCSSASDDDEDSSDDLDGTKQDARRARRCPPLTVKMIDFAHTWLVEGEGPDEGVLKGLGVLQGLVEGRRREVEEAIRAGAGAGR